jgi:hypothetical protein
MSATSGYGHQDEARDAFLVADTVTGCIAYQPHLGYGTAVEHFYHTTEGGPRAQKRAYRHDGRPGDDCGFAA